MSSISALFLSLLWASAALAGEVSQNYSKHYQDFYKEASKAGFEKGAVEKLSTQHTGAIEKNTAEVTKRNFNEKSRAMYKNPPKPRVEPKQIGKDGKSPVAGASPEATEPKRAKRNTEGAGTGGMSAGASKGAEKVTFGTPKN